MFLVIIYLFLMMEKISAGETVIKLSTLKKYVFKNAPKHWLAYIDKLLHRTTYMFRDIGFYLNGFTIDFISVKSYLIFYHNMRIISFLQATKYIYQPTIKIQNSSFILQKPFGKMKVDQNGEDLYDSKWVADNCESPHSTEFFNNYEYHWSFHWKFLLDKHLNINLTFEYIHISINNNLGCFIGKLEINNFNDDNSGFVYCGIHSYMIAYPSFNLINILLSLKSFVSCKIELSFAVTDPNRIVSYMRKNYEAVNPVWTVHFIKTQTFCDKFHLKDRQFKYLNILFTPKNSFTKEIFDGPSTMSKIIQPYFQNGREVYITSTFQCIIYVYLQSRIVAPNIAYESIEIREKSAVIIDRNYDINHINYPNCCSNSSLCAIIVEVTEHFRVNLTLSYLTTSLKRNDHCQYGGLTIFDKNNRAKTELLRVCMNHSFVHRQKNIYSTDSSMLLIFYSYPELRELNIVVKLGSTTCKLVYFNTCMNTDFFVTFPNSGCIVYQFSHDFDIKVYETYVRCGTLSCTAKLLFNTTVSYSREIKLHILGYLKGKKVSFVQGKWHSVTSSISYRSTKNFPVFVDQLKV